MSQCERIFGVLLDNNLSVKKHVYKTVKNACKMCNTILMNFKHNNIYTLTLLFICCVRPIYLNMCPLRGDLIIFIYYA